MWWSDQQRELWLFELTISYESVVADAKARKRAKYHDLVEAGRAERFKAELLTIEVGSRGMLGVSDFDAMKKAINASRKDYTDLCLQTIRTAILGSFDIWGSRNYIS